MTVGLYVSDSIMGGMAVPTVQVAPDDVEDAAQFSP
ncbi:hypothetical protein ACVWXL_009164 [Bradyrhizobium sp. GM22.5]